MNFLFNIVCPLCSFASFVLLFIILYRFLFIYFLITVELLGLISNIVLEVIQRKLFQVVTPSTTTDGNIGPDAVHLLAIRGLLATSQLCSSMYKENVNLRFCTKFKFTVYMKE